MSILFCTPCYGGMVHASHYGSGLQLKETLARNSIDHDWLLGSNESLVHRARMEMTLSYLKGTAYTHMMWKDADIEYTPDDVGKLWNMDADIAVGVYAMKKEGEEWWSAWKDGKLVDINELDGPTEVDYAGTGFMLIKRAALEAIYEYKKEDFRIAEEISMRVQPENDREIRILEAMVEALAADYEGPNGRVPALYMTPIYNDGLESEDYHFCRYARLAGFKIMMDPSVRLKHWGQKAYGKERCHSSQKEQSSTEGNQSPRTDPGISVPFLANGATDPNRSLVLPGNTKAKH